MKDQQSKGALQIERIMLRGIKSLCNQRKRSMANTLVHKTDWPFEEFLTG